VYRSYINSAKKTNENSADIRSIQNMLNKKFDANLDVDGELGQLTKQSIKKFLPSAKTAGAPDPKHTTRVQGHDKKVTEEHCPHCGGPMFSELMINEKKDACYYKVKSRYKVWPSAYASGSLVQCRKKGAANWGNKATESLVQELEENLHDWFHKEKWVRMDTKGNIKGDCAREPGEGKPKCLPAAKAHALGKKGRASAAQRKRRQDPNPERSGAAINVATKKKTNETAATMPPSPAAAAQARAIVQKAADDRAVSLARMAGVVPDNVAEDSGAWPFQELNELSNEKLAQYKSAAGRSATAADRAGNYELGNKRFRGITQATKKQFANDIAKHYDKAAQR